MAHTTLKIGETWTEITDANVTAITFNNKGGRKIAVAATVGSVAPADNTGSVVYRPHSGEVAIAIADLAPGLTGANRVFAKTFGGFSHVYVSHA